MLKPLVPHDPLTADLGFRAQRRQALNPVLFAVIAGAKPSWPKREPTTSTVPESTQKALQTGPLPHIPTATATR